MAILCCKVQLGTIHTQVCTVSTAKRFWFSWWCFAVFHTYAVDRKTHCITTSRRAAMSPMTRNTRAGLYLRGAFHSSLMLERSKKTSRRNFSATALDTSSANTRNPTNTQYTVDNQTGRPSITKYSIATLGRVHMPHDCIKTYARRNS